MSIGTFGSRNVEAEPGAELAGLGCRARPATRSAGLERRNHKLTPPAHFFNKTSVFRKLGYILATQTMRAPTVGFGLACGVPIFIQGLRRTT
jgi:hypothetical protein